MHYQQMFIGAVLAPILITGCERKVPSTTQEVVRPVRTMTVGVSAGSDGNVWFLEQNTQALGRITPQGDLDEFPLPPGNGGLRWLTLGPDGALWFTRAGDSVVGRFTMTARYSSKPVPRVGTNLYDISSGPDSTIWFTDINLGLMYGGRVR